ncbi:nucleotidyltransferase domain-containing protein [Actinomadura keratinilytica]
MGIAQDVARTVEGHPMVRKVTLVGSRARGNATELSDWDFHVTVDDFAEVAAVLPGMLAPYGPLAAQWDPLGDCASHLLIFPGPVKVDLLFPEMPRSWNPPWRVGPDTLPAIDAHFWDWALSLAGKRRHGMSDRVRGELLKMTRFLLGPLGVQTVPQTLEDAAARFVRARDRLETRYGLRISRRLEEEVLPLLRAPETGHYRLSS